MSLPSSSSGPKEQISSSEVTEELARACHKFTIHPNMLKYLRQGQRLTSAIFSLRAANGHVFEFKMAVKGDPASDNSFDCYVCFNLPAPSTHPVPMKICITTSDDPNPILEPISIPPMDQPFGSQIKRTLEIDNWQNPLKVRCYLHYLFFNLTTIEPGQPDLKHQKIDWNLTLANSLWKEHYLSNSFSDFKIICGNQEFSVHKFILGARSSVFQEMFKHEGFEENMKNELVITDFEPNIVSLMLEFMYSDKSIYGEFHLVSNKKELLKIADKYDFEFLKQTCEIDLEGSLRVGNATEYLLLAMNHNAKNLAAAAKTMVKKNLQKVYSTEGFTSLMNTYPNIFEVQDK